VSLPDGIEVDPLVQSEVDLLVPSGSGRRFRRALPLRALEHQRLVALQGGSAFRRHVEEAFRVARVAFRPAVEVGNLSLVRRFVAAGLGVAPVPRVAFSGKDALAGVERRRLGGVAPVTYHRAVRSGVPLPNAVSRLLELLAKQ
jgi:DNA-binding transcriptional LysR family regulator